MRARFDLRRGAEHSEPILKGGITGAEDNRQTREPMMRKSMSMLVSVSVSMPVSRDGA
jgi:hypothetical protein